MCYMHVFIHAIIKSDRRYVTVLHHSITKSVLSLVPYFNLLIEFWAVRSLPISYLFKISIFLLLPVKIYSVLELCANI